MNTFKQSIYGAITHVILLVFGIGFITLPIFLIKRSHTCIEVGDKFVKSQSGLFTIKTLETNISRIDAVTIEQGIFGRKLDYGKIIIRSGSSIHAYKNIERPHELKILIEERM